MKATETANVIYRLGQFELLMFVGGQWLGTGITSPQFADICDTADRLFERVLINAPINEAPPQRMSLAA